jgi:tetratricopeptide (TPR) repeat protein
MQNFIKHLPVTALITIGLLLSADQALSQLTNDAEAPNDAQSAETVIEDEIISRGSIVTGQHDGMDAFFRGDFETAEIEFENEFKSLRRFESARENAARDSALSADRALMTEQAGSTFSSSVNSRGASALGQTSSNTLSANPSVTSNFISRRNEGRTILTDGEVTYQDFGFTRYMSGLSEIKLGKFAEAKTSFKQSLRYDEANYDARMRLGLLDIMDADFEAAADHLEKLDQQRQRCERRSCDDLESLREATITLAQQLTQAVETG